MKYLICSDIHGSETALEKLLTHYYSQKCDFFVCLGDILYHGPRNPLPEGHNPKGVVSLLNNIAGHVIACRGNCDAEIDQQLLQFPLMSDYAWIVDNGTRIFCTHGHIYRPDTEAAAPGTETAGRIAPLESGDVFLYGHTHVQALHKDKKGILICNPGSISLPKNESAAGFAVYDNRQVTLYDLDGKVLKSLPI